TDLPALAPAFIWYPYGESAEFPQLGSGGRNAMAGPVYYSDLYTADTKFPDYYDGKIFIYDWIRGWVKAVTMNENGDFEKMESFMPNTKFNAIIDMEMGPDGRIYILEYGNGWFSKNPDAGLSRIDFNGGNRAPSVSQISADKTSGSNPLTVTFTATSSDPENDPMTYVWDLGNGETKTTEVPSLTHTFNTIGEYEVKVTAKDPAGLTGTSSIASVYSGNIAPEVAIAINGNQTFYFPGKKVNYSVSISDADNPDAASDLSTLYISADYIEGLDKAESDMGHKVMTEAMLGKSLFTTLTCKTCHKEAEASVGPSYLDVAKKYSEKDIDYLKNKIKNGGGGVWGETAMPANPDMKDSDLNALVAYILSLDQVTTPSLPASGSVDATAGKNPTTSGVLMLTASYTDQGGENIKPLTGSTTVLLRNNTIDMGTTGEYTGGYSSMNYDGNNLVVVPKNEASFAIKSIDLTDITSVTSTAVTIGDLGDEYVFELRLDSPTGELLGSTTFVQSSANGSANAPSYSQFTIPLAGQTDGKPHSLFVVTKPKNTGGSGTFVVAGMTFNSK
ncbi:MAG: PKD domain-containing protein, partial [Algoriphagus sp.]